MRPFLSGVGCQGNALFRFRIDGVNIRHGVGAVNARQTLLARVRAGDNLSFRGIARIEEIDVGLIGRGEGLEPGSVDVDLKDSPAFIVFGDTREHNAFAVPVEFRFENRTRVFRFIDRLKLRIVRTEIGKNTEFGVPAFFGDLVDRHEVVADRGQARGTYDEEFQVVEFGEREERLAAEFGEFLFPGFVFRLFLFERVKLFEVGFAVGVIVAELHDHVVNGASHRLDRVHGPVVVVAGKEPRLRRAREKGERKGKRRCEEKAFHIVVPLEFGYIELSCEDRFHDNARLRFSAPAYSNIID